jgi:hypothetical protein
MAAIAAGTAQRVSPTTKRRLFDNVLNDCGFNADHRYHKSHGKINSDQKGELETHPSGEGGRLFGRIHGLGTRVIRGIDCADRRDKNIAAIEAHSIGPGG